MAIMYNVPFTGSQKGPTCWYYATKMLLRFHGVLDPNKDKPAGWKELHAVRKTITQLAKTGDGRKKEQVVQALYQQKLSADPAAKGAVEKLENVDLHLSDRHDVVTNFVGNYFKPVELKEWNARGIETALRENGPMYASIYSTQTSSYTLATFFYGDADRKEDPHRTGHFVYSTDQAARNDKGPRHAVVICGVNNDSIYYCDPNRPDLNSWESWDSFSGWLNSSGGAAFTGMKLFFCVDCTLGKGKCPHLQ